MKYFLILSPLFLFISCSKNNSSGTPSPQDSTCQITSVKWVHDADSFTTTLSYNSDGKLSKTDDGLGNITSYTYSGNRIFITSNNNATFFDTTTLNSFGFIAQFAANSTTFLYYNSFFYTADTVLSYMVYTSPARTDPPDTTTCRFTGGDLTTVISDGLTDNYTYYPDKSEQPADLTIYNQMIEKGALAISNKHLTKSYSSNSFGSEYTYTFDASGKILSITDHEVNGQTSGTVNYYYSYACHL